MTDTFDDIRSYRDDETQEVSKRLLSNPALRQLLQQLLPEFQSINEEALISGLKNRWEFQDRLMKPILERNIIPTFDELTFSGLEKLDPKKAYLFISNHRDIVLDSAVMNYFLHVNGFSTAEIAIGDNLLKEKWIEDLVRVNKSFIVKRGGDKLERLKASKRMSAYIKDTILNRKESVWIAQRAGRAKDGNDATNPGLLKMFAMSADGDPKDYFCQLNIVPVTVSYEYDPCDARKAREILTERHEGEYVKSENEDVESMKLGIVLPKGKGHLHFGSVLSDEIAQLPRESEKEDITPKVAELIDRHIHANYKLWNTNYIANDLLENGVEETTEDNAEKKAFRERMLRSLQEMKIDVPEGREIFLNMYQQPLLNKEG